MIARLLILLLLATLVACAKPPAYAPYDFWHCVDMRAC